ncbi:MAG TPA: hypothetical protein DER23_04615 [Clostridiales bacterium]|nr:hypothetical protein [Clostridiales bacterium]HCG35609.1 hypothetical protein [Clostridiales bacterium]
MKSYLLFPLPWLQLPFRDFIMPDGSYRTNAGFGNEKKAFGNIDPDVAVIRINNADGSPQE